MVYDAIYIDIFNLFYRMHYGLQKEDAVFRGNIYPVQGIRGALRRINNLEKDNLTTDGKIYLCFDNFSSRVNYRRTIDEAYKANRAYASKEFYGSLQLLTLILKNYADNFIYCRGDGLEADDLVPYLIEHSGVKHHLVVSADMDWARVINYKGQHVDWHNGKILMTRNEFESRYQFEPNEQTIINYKAYRGDKADNIEPGWPKLKTELMLQLIEYGDIEEVYADRHIIDFLSTTHVAQLQQYIGQLLKNKKLVSFLPLEGHDLEVTPCRRKPETANKLLKVFGLPTLTTRSYNRTQTEMPEVVLEEGRTVQIEMNGYLVEVTPIKKLNKDVP